MNVLSECMFVYYIHAWCSWSSEEGIRFSGIGIIDGCESLCVFCEQNPGSLQEQHFFFFLLNLLDHFPVSFSENFIMKAC